MSTTYVRVAVGDLAVRASRRSMIVGAVLAGLAVILVLLSLLSGSFALSLLDTVRALGGHGSLAARYFVNDVRLPRALVAVLVGAALAVAGALFQSMTGSPLGSPDVIGFNAGAAAGAVLGLLVMRGSGVFATGLGAVAGGAVVAVAVYVLAYRDGVRGLRLILVGVGMNALLGAGIAYLLSRADLVQSLDAQVWLVGSLTGRGWTEVWTLVATLVVVLPCAFALSRPLAALELGDDSATSLGVRVDTVRRGVIGCAVLLSAVSIVAAGPISFVALAAPAIGKLLARSVGPSLTVSALTGGCLLALADLLGQRAPGDGMPVGVVTLILGGLYLGWLLLRQSGVRGK